MSRDYLPLPAMGLKAGARFHQPAQPEPRRVGCDDPAAAVMTDFRKLRALTIHAGATLDSAQEKMAANGVHLLLVVTAQNALAGLITSTDIQGEKPLQLVQQRGIRRAEVLVADAMTPAERLEVIDMDDVLQARVGHVVATLKAVGRQHAMVVDCGADGRQTVRGLFSASQLARQLGRPVPTHEVARNFAQVGELLSQ